VTFNHMPPYVGDLIVAQPQLYPYLRDVLAEASEA
jgi:hypothetical protein